MIRQSFRKITLTCLCVSAGLLTAPALAASERPMREARSENGRFMLRIDYGRDTARSAKPCRATLLSREAGRTQRIWDRTLVNDVAPMQALIRNDGKFVVTLDEFRRGGARHALVVYGANGELLRHLLLPDLLTPQDMRHAEVRGRRIDWLSAAEYGFRGDDFVIRLPDVQIHVELLTGQVERYRNGDLIVGGQSWSTENWADYLGATFADDPNAFATYAAGQALESAGEMFEGEDALEPFADAEMIEDEASDVLAAQLAPDEFAPALEDDDALGMEVTAAALDPGPFAPLPVATLPPLPDPAERVNYIDWLNAQMPPQDENAAVPLYEAAIAELAVFLNEDPNEAAWDAFNDALDGDATAAAGPELADFLQRNAAAIAKFREAARRPYAGQRYESNGETLAEMMLPSLSGMRNLAAMTTAVGRKAAAEGDLAGAVDAYLDVTASGAHMTEGMTLIERLVGHNIQGAGRKALLDAYTSPGADEIDYEQLAVTLRATAVTRRSPADILRGERAVLLDVAQRVYRPNAIGELEPDAAGVSTLTSLMYDGGSEEEVAHQLSAHSFDDVVNETEMVFDAFEWAFDAPYPERAAMLTFIDSLVPQLGPVTRRLTPSLSRLTKVEARDHAMRRGTVLLTELKAYRQRTGSYPASLDELGDPDLAVDPATGGRFVYRNEGGQITLYSTGFDGVDNGGVHSERFDDPGIDLVIWPRPLKDD